MVLSTFFCMYLPLVCSLWEKKKKCLFDPSVHFSIRLFGICYWAVSVLYRFYINPLPDIWHANFFSHSIGWLFIFIILLCRTFWNWGDSPDDHWIIFGVLLTLSWKIVHICCQETLWFLPAKSKWNISVSFPFNSKCLFFCWMSD